MFWLSRTTALPAAGREPAPCGCRGQKYPSDPLPTRRWLSRCHVLPERKLFLRYVHHQRTDQSDQRAGQQNRLQGRDSRARRFGGRGHIVKQPCRRRCAHQHHPGPSVLHGTLPCMPSLDGVSEPLVHDGWLRRPLLITCRSPGGRRDRWLRRVIDGVRRTS